LNVLGLNLKYLTPIDNRLLPVVLFAVAFIVTSIWGYFSSVYVDSARIVDSLLMCGVCQGIAVTSIAVYGWDSIHGMIKFGTRTKKKKEVQT
jgi:hypothetical protein